MPNDTPQNYAMQNDTLKNDTLQSDTQHNRIEQNDTKNDILDNGRHENAPKVSITSPLMSAIDSFPLAQTVFNE